MLIASLEQKVALHAVDAEAAQPQTMAQLAVELGGRQVAGPDAVGEALRELVKAAKAENRHGAPLIDRAVGRFGGFRAGPDGGAWRGDASAVPGRSLPLRRPTLPDGSGLVSALLAALTSVAEQHARTGEQLSVRRKRRKTCSSNWTVRLSTKQG